MWAISSNQREMLRKQQAVVGLLLALTNEVTL